MNQWAKRVDELDIGLFAAIPSQTSDGCRRSLLAVQRATARQYGSYNYLEIGSHLGGSIQPHLLDDRCMRIYSIDPRPAQQPDDRSSGAVFHYEDNSSERMLNLLAGIGGGNISKIECIELTTSGIDVTRIADRPHMAFIDGEHTRAAVLMDFNFCRKVLRERGTIVFHDFDIIYPAVRMICRELRACGASHVAIKLEGKVFAIFFDSDLVSSDAYLCSMRNAMRGFWVRFLAKMYIKKTLPPAFWEWQWNIRFKNSR